MRVEFIQTGVNRRDLTEQREFVAAERARIEAEKAERERPVREMAEANAKLQNEVNESAKALIARGDIDPTWKTPASALTISLPKAEAHAFAKDEAKKFVQVNPDWYPTDANFKQITSFLERNGVSIPNVECFQLAFERLSALGLLEAKPVEVAQPVTQEPALTTEEQREKDIEEKSRRLYEYENTPVCSFEGKNLTQMEIDRLPADDYLRVMRVRRIKSNGSPVFAATRTDGTGAW